MLVPVYILIYQTFDCLPEKKYGKRRFGNFENKSDKTYLIIDSLSILTPKRNASSKTLHNLLHEHHTCAKVWYILIFVCVSLIITY